MTTGARFLLFLPILFLLVPLSKADPLFFNNNTYNNLTLENDNRFDYSKGNISFEIRVNETYGKLLNVTFRLNNTNYTEYVSTQNLTMWLDTNEGFGRNSFDRSGSNHSLSMKPQAVWHYGANCTYGNCLFFDGGSNSYAEVYNETKWWFNDSFATAFWIKFGNGNVGGDRAIDNQGSGPADGWRCGLSATTGSQGKINCEVRKATAAVELIGNYPKNNTWHFIVFSFENKTQTCNLYVNGSLEATSTSCIMGPSVQRRLTLGSRAGQFINPINATLDDVRIWLRPLNQSEVLQLYWANKGGGNYSFVYDIPDGVNSSIIYTNLSEPQPRTQNFSWFVFNTSSLYNSTGNITLTLTTCSYVGPSTWYINAGDFCTISSVINTVGNDIAVFGNGFLTLKADIINVKNVFRTGVFGIGHLSGAFKRETN